MRRAGARSGDILAITGELGGAAAGLLLLDRPELAADRGPAEVADPLRLRQLEPGPRLRAGRLSPKPGQAMIDLSDGLGGDAGQIADPAACGVVELERLPLQAGVGELAAAAGVDSTSWRRHAGRTTSSSPRVPKDRVHDALQAVAFHGLRADHGSRIVGFLSWS